MRRTGINKVLKIGWGWIIFLVLILPAMGFLLQLLYAGIMVNYEKQVTVFVFMLYPFFALAFVYACWQYVISVRVNSEYVTPKPLKSLWYRILFWNGFVFMVLSTVIFSYPLLLATIKPDPDGWFVASIGFLIAAYLITLPICFLYCSYFTSRVLKALFARKEKETIFFEKIPYFLLVLIFPIGIPFFNDKFERHYGPKARYLVEID